ncbi:MAG: hypothetical protein ACI8W7_004216 [Gammaproteobacteria bacterium]|jgi:hypothetical protein
MKELNYSFYARLAVASALAMVSVASHADAGHSVPSGVFAQQHLHLFDQVVASPIGLLVAAFSAVALGILVMKARRAGAKVD